MEKPFPGAEGPFPGERGRSRGERGRGNGQEPSADPGLAVPTPTASSGQFLSEVAGETHPGPIPVQGHPDHAKHPVLPQHRGSGATQFSLSPAIFHNTVFSTWC